MKTFAEFTTGVADAKPAGFPTFSQVREGEEETKAPKCVSEELQKKLDECYEAMCNEMKACHEDETDNTAESYLKECNECWDGMKEKLMKECESYMAAMH